MSEHDDNDPRGSEKEWWIGHGAGFAKGLEEARLHAIDLAKENPDAASALRLLAHTLYELATPAKPR